MNDKYRVEMSYEEWKEINRALYGASLEMKGVYKDKVLRILNVRKALQTLNDCLKET